MFLVIMERDTNRKQLRYYLQPNGCFSSDFSKAAQFTRRVTATRVAESFTNATIAWSMRKADPNKKYRR